MRFRMLGPIEVLDDDGVPVALPGGRARAILSMLLIARPHVVSQAKLFETGQTAKDPANALHVQISKLRAVLPKQRLVSEHGGYKLITRPGEVDVDVFVETCSQGQRLAEAGDHTTAVTVLRDALAMWQDPTDYDFTESWRATLEEQRLAALENVINGELAIGRHLDVVPELTGLVAAHPLRERFTGLLMRALHKSGRRSEALSAFAELRLRLADELGVDPAPEITAQHMKILCDEPVAPTRQPGNVPYPVGTLVGRDDDLDDLRGLLEEQRLVTVAGPGGVGKTRIGCELGHRLRDRVLSYLRDRDVLLVLDNCEHVIDEAAESARFLLGHCPNLTILATSREPLRVAGERPFQLAPLALPAAVRLFRDRAPAVRADDAALSHLCARLDGLPLMIELAAAGSRLFSLDEIESRLDELSNSSRHAPTRHHSLRALLDWSYELLTDAERRVLSGLSIFRDGCTFTDAERVCGATIEVLAQLVDKSLVVSGRDGRFRLLETVRAYAESMMDTTVIGSFDAAPSSGCDTQLALALGWHGWLGMRASTVADPWQSLKRLRLLHRSTATPQSVAIAFPRSRWPPCTCDRAGLGGVRPAPQRR
jgi:DNA-binding SARP family transcriptional activator